MSKSFKKILINVALFAAFGVASGLKRAVLGRYIALNVALSWWSERRNKEQPEQIVNKADNTTEVQTDIPIPVLLGLGLLDGNIFDASAKQDQSFPLYAAVGYNALIGKDGIGGIELVDRTSITLTDGVLDSFTLITKDADTGTNIASQSEIRKSVRFANDASKTLSNVVLKFYPAGLYTPGGVPGTAHVIKDGSTNLITPSDQLKLLISPLYGAMRRIIANGFNPALPRVSDVSIELDTSDWTPPTITAGDFLVFRDAEGNLLNAAEVSSVYVSAIQDWERDAWGRSTGYLIQTVVPGRIIIQVSTPITKDLLEYPSTAATITLYTFGGTRSADAYLKVTSPNITNTNKLAWMAVDIRDPGNTVTNVTYSVPSIQILAYRGRFWAWESLVAASSQTMHQLTGLAAYNTNPIAYIYEAICNPYFSRGGGPGLINITNFLVNFAECAATDTNLAGSGNVNWKFHGYKFDQENSVLNYVKDMLRHIQGDYFIDQDNKFNIFLNNGKIYTDAGYVTMDPANCTVIHRDMINRRMEKGEVGELKFKISDRSSRIEFNEWRVRFTRPDKEFIADTYLSLSDTVSKFLDQQDKPTTLEYRAFYEERYAKKAALIEMSREKYETEFFEIDVDLATINLSPGDVIFLPAFMGSWDQANLLEQFLVCPTSTTVGGDDVLYFPLEDRILLDHAGLSGFTLYSTASGTVNVEEQPTSVNRTQEGTITKLGHGVVRIVTDGNYTISPGEAVTITRTGYTSRDFAVIAHRSIGTGEVVYVSTRPLFDMEGNGSLGDIVEIGGLELTVEEAGYEDDQYYIRVNGEFTTDPTGQVATLKRSRGIKQLAEDCYAKVQEMKFNDELTVTITARKYEPDCYGVTAAEYGVFVPVVPVQQFIDPANNAPPTPEFYEFSVNALPKADGTVTYEVLLVLTGLSAMSVDRTVVSLYATNRTLTGGVAKVTDQGLTVYASIAGEDGNDLSVQLLNPGVLTANCGFVVVGDLLQITLRHNGAAIACTVDDVIEDWINFAGDSIRSVFSVVGTGEDNLTATSELPLTGGTVSTEKSLLGTQTLNRGQNSVSFILPADLATDTITKAQYWATAVSYNKNNLASGIASSYTQFGYLSVTEETIPSLPPYTPEFLPAECYYGATIRVVSKKYTRIDQKFLELRTDDEDWGVFNPGSAETSFAGIFSEQVIFEKKENLPNTRVIEYYVKAKNSFNQYSETPGYIELTDAIPIQIPTGNVITTVAGNTVFIEITPYDSGNYERDVTKYSMWNSAGDTKLTESSVPRWNYTVPYSAFGDSDTLELTFKVLAHDRLTEILNDGVLSSSITVTMYKIQTAELQLEALRESIGRQLLRLDEWGSATYSSSLGEQMILDSTNGYSFVQERVLDPETEYVISAVLQKTTGTDPVQLTISGPVVGSPIVLEHNTSTPLAVSLKITTTADTGPIPRTVFTVTSTEASIASKIMLNKGALALPYVLHVDDEIIGERLRLIHNDFYSDALTKSDQIRQMNQSQIEQGARMAQVEYGVSLSVRKDNVVSEINLSPEGVMIAGRKIIIDGLTVFINTTGYYYGTFVNKLENGNWLLSVASATPLPASGTIYQMLTPGAGIADNDSWSSAINFTRVGKIPTTGHWEVATTGAEPTFGGFWINGNSFSVTKIDGGRIIANSIQTDHLQANSIVADKIAANQIGAEKLIAKDIVADVIRLFGKNNIIIDPDDGIFIFHNNNILNNSSSHYAVNYDSGSDSFFMPTANVPATPPAVGDFIYITGAGNYTGVMRKILNVSTSGSNTYYEVDGFATSPGATTIDFIKKAVTTGSYIKITIDGTGLPAIQMYQGTSGTALGTTWTPTGFVLENGSIKIGDGANSFHVNTDGDMWFGSNSFSSAPFRVGKDGTLRVGPGSTNMTVDNEGNVTVGSGNTVTKIDKSGNLWIGHANKASAPFVVNNDGSVAAASLTLANIDLIHFTQVIQVIDTGLIKQFVETGSSAFNFVLSSTPAPIQDTVTGNYLLNPISSSMNECIVYTGPGFSGLSGSQKRSRIKMFNLRFNAPLGMPSSSKCNVTISFWTGMIIKTVTNVSVPSGFLQPAVDIDILAALSDTDINNIFLDGHQLFPIYFSVLFHNSVNPGTYNLTGARIESIIALTYLAPPSSL